MATSILMAKIPTKGTTTPVPQKPKCSPAATTTTLRHAPQEAVGRLICHPQLRSAVLSVSTAAAALSASSAMPALAAEIEKAKLFDFNLTLPIIAAEFLVLMFALDKIYFTPLGKFMDERDAAIREKLNSVKDTSEEVKQLEDQAAAILRAARAEISAALNQMKKEVSAEVEAKLAEGRKKVEAELAAALENLARQKEETMRSLDSQIAALSDEVVKKVLPF